MTILLSAYFPEGIIFSADRNLTKTYPDGQKEILYSATEKVFQWENGQAVVGYTGIAKLAGKEMKQWIQDFIALNADFNDPDELAISMKNQIQADFENDYPFDTSVEKARLIIHLGAFRKENNFSVPALYHIRNVPGYDKDGNYNQAEHVFKLNEKDDVRVYFERSGTEYPEKVKEKLQKDLNDRNHFLWFNNGANFPWFNTFKESLWKALAIVRQPFPPTLNDRIAFCEMAVNLFGSYYEHYCGTDD